MRDGRRAAAALAVSACVWCCAAQNSNSYSSYAAAPSTPFNLPQQGPGPVQYASGSLYFPAALSVYPETVFVGNGGCSPSAQSDVLAIANMSVPTVERQHLAMHLYQTNPNQQPNPTLYDVVWMDLVTGQLVTAQSGLNWSTQTTVFNYSSYGPNLVDYANYVAVLNSTLARVQGLASGQSASGSVSSNCASQGDSRLDSLVSFLQTAQANVSEPSRIRNGTRPTELWLPTNCIQELDANFQGSSVSGIITANGTSQTVNACCALCRNTSGCNVFTYCPLQGGCPYGNNQTFPYQGCQLKYQAGTSLDPLYVPPAYARGPPEAFTSGRT